MWKRERSYLVVCPAWYAFGEMFESLFLAANLAFYYRRKLILSYSTVHLRENTHLPAICNHELKTFLVKEYGYVGEPDSFISKLLSQYINISRKYRMTLSGKIVRRLSGEKLLKPKIGFPGHSSDKELQKMLGLKRPVNWENVLKKPVQIDLTPEQDERGKQAYKELEIPDDKPYVCLYVRDLGFIKSHAKRKIFQFYSADIKTYEKCIDFISRKGFYIIRMGDPSAEPVNTGAKLIDYVHTPYYSELLDLYLYRYCEVMVSTGGGVRMAAIFYNKDTIVTNWTQIHISGYCRNTDLLILKHVFSVKHERLLSLREQLELIDVETDRWGFFNPDKYIYLDNTEEELFEIVNDWYLSREDTYFDWNDQLQKEYHDLRIKHIRRRFDAFAANSDTESGHEKYCHFRPKIGRRFLENCWDYGSYLEKLTAQFHDQYKDSSLPYLPYGSN